MPVDVRYNSRGRYNMFGDRITQQWARDALPVIVERAKVCDVIRYGELRSAIGTTTDRKWGNVCNIISMTLYQLEHNELQQQWRRRRIPRLSKYSYQNEREPWRVDVRTNHRRPEDCSLEESVQDRIHQTRFLLSTLG